MPEAKYPIYIRNVRYVPYLELAQFVGVLLLPVWFVGSKSLVGPRFSILWSAVVPALGIGLLVFALTYSNVCMQRGRFGIRFRLVLNPQSLTFGPTLKATQLRRLIYLNDPKQDYADDIAKRVVLVHIEPQEGRLIRLFCSTDDLEHLSTWANANGVPVSDQRERGTDEPTL